MCQFAQNWPLNGRPLVNDYRGRVLLLVFTAMDSSRKECEREMKRLDTLSERFSDVRVLGVAPRAVKANEVRAFAWQLPRIRFERETEEAPVWRWFNATQLDKAIFDRCSRLVGWLPSGADFATVLSLLQNALFTSPCGHCDFDSGKKRINWPSFHPPVPQKKDVFVHIDGLPLGPPSLLRRWNSPSAHGEMRRGQIETDAEKRRRMHWTVDNEQQQQRKTSADSKQQQRSKNVNDQQHQFTTATPIGVSSRQKQMPNYRANYEQQQKYLYGQQFGQIQQQQQRHDQQQQSSSRGMTKVPTHEQQRHANGETERRKNDGTGNGLGQRGTIGHNNQREGWQAAQQQQQMPLQRQTSVVATTAAALTDVEPAPLYPEGSENAVGGDDYYGDEYAAEWTTKTPEAARQIPAPTKAMEPTPPTPQTDKNFGFELPCTGFSDESCFQQQTQLRPNEVHRCCRGRILFTDQCAVGKCSNATVQLCCIQRFLQAKLTCCSDERQADAEVGDHFSRCCFEHFVDGEDPCCPRAYAAEHWRSVHELCLPNVEMDLTGVKVPSPLVGTTLITEFDFSKTDRWRFECRYGSHVQQYSYFDASASAENDQQQQRNEEEDE